MTFNAPALRSISSVEQLLTSPDAISRVRDVATTHLSAERMMRLIDNSARKTPMIMQCEPMSLLGASMYFAALGLEPNTPLGHGYIIPFKNRAKGIVEAQAVIGYKGFKALAMRSGMVTNLHADVVYDDDEYFSHEYGSNQHLRHKPGPRQGKILGAYCYCKLTAGEGHVYMTAAEILELRDKSEGWKAAVRFNRKAESPWETATVQMFAKTAVRRLANSGDLPMASEVLELATMEDTPADYRGFALDPTRGLQSDETIEGKAEEPESEPEQKLTQAAKPKVEPSKQESTGRPPAGKSRPATKDDGVGAAGGESQVTPQSSEATAGPAESDEKSQGEKTDPRVEATRIRDGLINNLVDASGGIADLEQHFPKKINFLKEKFPDLWNDVLNVASSMNTEGDDEA